MEPKFFSNLARDQLVNALLERVMNVPSFFILSIVAIFNGFTDSYEVS
jgi:hypothetical protein